MSESGKAQRSPRLVFTLVAVVLGLSALACQSTQEKNALFLKDRVERLRVHEDWKPVQCKVKSELSAPQIITYRKAYPDEAELVENWNVIYDWTARTSRCQVHANPLTPASANQRSFVEEAFCTLIQVFYVHSPFDGLIILPSDMMDREDHLFLRQKENSELGIYLDKNVFGLETKTAHNGTYSAQYAQVGANWLPSDLRHQTMNYIFELRDFEWDSLKEHAPPKSFWIYLSEKGMPIAHTRLEISECRPI